MRVLLFTVPYQQDSLSILFDPDELKGFAKDASDLAGALSERLEGVPLVGDRLTRDSPAGATPNGPFEVPAAARLWSQDAQQAGEDIRFPLALPSLTGPARFYFSFGAPVDTAPLDPKDRNACAAVNAQVKAAVQAEIDWLLLKRRDDPFAALAPRLLYERLHPGQQAPTFAIGAAKARAAAVAEASAAPVV